MSKREELKSGEGRGGAESKDKKEGNVSHEPCEPERPREWTQEEMDNAVPMPMPEIPDDDPD